jgi:uncharacterized protein YjbJ (UPF0337 family)
VIRLLNPLAFTCGPKFAVLHGVSIQTAEAMTENTVNSSIADQIEGKLHEVKGSVKEAAGQAVGNPDLEAEGQAETLGGKIQKKLGEIKQVFEP